MIKRKDWLCKTERLAAYNGRNGCEKRKEWYIYRRLDIPKIPPLDANSSVSLKKRKNWHIEKDCIPEFPSDYRFQTIGNKPPNLKSGKIGIYTNTTIPYFPLLLAKRILIRFDKPKFPYFPAGRDAGIPEFP